MNEPKKSLGQHWLRDEATLASICDSANLSQSDTVLEIGPGLGNLTRQLVKHVRRVVAVELDESLAAQLPKLVKSSKLEIIQADILKFDTVQLPRGYKVVANIPYYLTSNLLRVLSESANPPAAMTLLVQKEVAERVCAQPGHMSILAISAQLDYECKLGQVVPAKMFEPPPKVDSQAVLLKRRPKPLFADLDRPKYFRVVKAGFSERRKKLRSSLAGGLGVSREQADQLLRKAGVNGGLRAQNLSLKDWYEIYERTQDTGLRI